MSHVAFEAEAAAKTEHPRSPCAREFQAVYRSWPQAEAQAPGRVNLLGEHTDYNDGFVLPVAIPQQTRVAMARNHDGHFRLHAAELDSAVAFTLDDEPQE